MPARLWAIKANAVADTDFVAVFVADDTNQETRLFASNSLRCSFRKRLLSLGAMRHSFNLVFDSLRFSCLSQGGVILLGLSLIEDRIHPPLARLQSHEIPLPGRGNQQGIFDVRRSASASN